MSSGMSRNDRRPHETQPRFVRVSDSCQITWHSGSARCSRAQSVSPSTASPVNDITLSNPAGGSAPRSGQRGVGSFGRYLVLLALLALRADGTSGRAGGFLLAAMQRRRIPATLNRMRLRCLLVDDNGAFLEAASALLQREGVTVLGVASSTAEALRQIRALQPDVILVDIGLGDESGFDLARRLAQGGQGGSAEVILISARAETDYAELIAESPAAGFLAKSELSARGIGRILGQTP